MSTKEREQALQYWTNRFRVGQDGSDFPADHRRSCVQEQARAHAAISISNASWSRFTSICERNGIAPWHAVVGLLQILLHRYTLTDTVEIGVQIGSVLAVRTEIAPSSTVRQNLLQTVVALEDARVKGCSCDELQLWSAETGFAPARPLFRTFLAIVDPASASEKDGVALQTRCDVYLSLTLGGVQPCIEAEYASNLYKKETVHNILRQFTFLTESLDATLDQAVDRMPLCATDDANALVQGIACDCRDFHVTSCVHQHFEEQARKTPYATAVIMPGDPPRQLTYEQLNVRANRLAHYLQLMGVGPDVLVGLYLDRTPDLIVAMLAILKAGGAYLPIDLSYPSDRVAFMLTDAESPMVLTDSETARKLPETAATVIRVDEDQAAWASMKSENPSSNVTPKNLAYCIFTSGSTGKPKGVLITHSNVSRLFCATDPWFQFNDQDVWTFFHSSAFDFSVWEIWGALIFGGRLVIVPFADSRSPERFYELLAAQGVTVLNQTPSAFRQLVGVDEATPNVRLNQLRLVIFGGEALNLQSLEPWFAKYGDARPQLVNMYGITETTVHVTYRPLKHSDLNEAPGSVIGRAIPDLQVYILDAAMQPVPMGVPGEVFVGGAGVARGYLKRAALTAERFVDDPFSDREGAKLYRSGDLARRVPGGDLEYMGRLDHQVKIRGFRIELGEVQSALTREPSVREAFVMAKEVDGEKVLIAYVVLAGGEVPAVDKLRRALQATLPSYMVPSSFVFLDQLPLTQNGKIDRTALPSPSVGRSEMEQPFSAPQTDLERGIARIYQEVLNLDRVGADDDFFDLGGHSLLLAEAHSRLQKLLGANFSVAELFMHTTVRKLAASFNHAGHKAHLPTVIMDRAQRQRQAISGGNWRR